MYTIQEVDISVLFGTEDATLGNDDSLGDWDLVECVGTGAVSRVYRARNIVSGSEAALKLYEPGTSDPEIAREMFLTEEWTLRTLKGVKHVLQLHPDHDPSLADRAIATELADRGSLADRLPKILAFGTVITIGTQVLDALEVTHTRRIVHLDVKPANILIDRAGNVQVADWGTAVDLDEVEGMDQDGKFVPCTPLYMAPEQAEHHRFDGRTDLYSLGCTLYEALTGVPAFAPDGAISPLEAMLRHVKLDGPNPRARNRRVPRCLADTVERAMKRKPEDRFQSAREMREALEWCAS